MTTQQAKTKFATLKRHRVMCAEGYAFAEGKSLEDAWATCQVGQFMAWWLHEAAGVDLEALRKLKIRTAPDLPVGTLTWSDWGYFEKLRWAEILRKHYTMLGTKRKVRA